MKSLKFAVVTTSYQPGEYLLETLHSVIGQGGDFELHYHVQDAGSADNTVEYLKSIAGQLANQNIPVQCKKLTFSYRSEPDHGMYDGINRGFRHILRNADADIMLWINADDVLALNALAKLAAYFTNHPNTDWLIGRTVHLDEHSNIMVNIPPHRYRKQDLQAGRHDGVVLPYVTQESCVWRRELWERTGELASSYMYAGDYEYWVRASINNFELKSEEIEVGYHRKRKGQLSSVGFYQDEIRLVKLKYCN